MTEGTRDESLSRLLPGTHYSPNVSDGINARTAVPVSIASLLPGVSLRIRGENSEHIELLAASEAPLPPILVHRDTMQVIDGMHRLRAALLRGQDTIKVRFFDGSQADAFVHAVKANTEHGLPLTLAEREAAAARIVVSHPRCSDRWIASITGLAVGTVALIRGRVSPDDGQTTARIGRDGRVRPVDPEVGRRLAGDAITRYPGASLRAIARMAGISPTTVRDVKARMLQGEDQVAPRKPGRQNGRRGGAAETSASQRDQSRAERDPLRSAGTLLEMLRRDPSLRLTESGRSLLRWLEWRIGHPDRWKELADSAPPHCAYLIAELARSCAAEWLTVAEHLEERVSAEVQLSSRSFSSVSVSRENSA